MLARARRWWLVLAAAGIARAAHGYSFQTLVLPPGSNPTGLTAGADGLLYVTDAGKNSLGAVYDPLHGFSPGAPTTHSVPTGGAYPASPARGPDGNVWFCENSKSKIARLNKFGLTIDEYATPTASSAPNGITAGPDGNLWFAEILSTKIGRSTPSGTITEFDVGASSTGVANGSDGALWVATGGAILRVDTTGSVTNTYPIPGGEGAYAIVPGPDGALWFSRQFSIGRVTTAGVVTSTPLGHTDSFVNGIAPGPDGNVWFVEGPPANKLGRITSAGVITEFAVPGATNLFAIGLGPHKNLWLADYAGKLIRVRFPIEEVPGRYLPFQPSGFDFNATGDVVFFTDKSGVGTVDFGGAWTVTSPPTSSSEPFQIVRGPDGAFWFTEYAAAKIGRTTSSSVFDMTEYPVGAQPSIIVSGPDGALWFTEQSANKIGRLTTDGLTFSEVTVPTPASEPYGLVVAGGKLWFGEFHANKIGRVDPGTLQIAEFSIPSPNSDPFLLDVGPDGNVWFCEFLANKVAKVATSGSVGDITEYTVSPNAGPIGVTAGPDGAVWFTEYTAGKIGRMTTNGVLLEEFPAPTRTGHPFLIKTGPDGNVWFGELDGSGLGRVTRPGDVNTDGKVDVNDVFALINLLFAGGTANGVLDANGDGTDSVADVFYLINYLFAGGPLPKI
jgi:streptogramin lyase